MKECLLEPLPLSLPLPLAELSDQRLDCVHFTLGIYRNRSLGSSKLDYSVGTVDMWDLIKPFFSPPTHFTKIIFTPRM